MKKSKGTIAKMLSPILVAVIVITGIVNLILPDRSTSPMENRSLQAFPSMNWNSFQNGDVFRELNSWYSDQFLGREKLIQLKYLVNKMAGTNKIDDVFLGKGTLIEDVSSVNQEQKERNLQAINAFCTSYEIPSYFMIAPNAVSVQSDKLPAFSTPLDQDQQIDEYYDGLDSSIQRIDVRSTLEEHKDEYLYYKTDHHWTSLGAFYSFQAMASAMGLGDVSKKDYDIYPVSDDFEGTLAGKTGSVFLKDQIDIYVPKNNSEYIVSDLTNVTTSRSIYSREALDTRDQYTVFMGGNAGRITIEMDNDSSRHLLLIKDSYANAMIQFLIPYYRTIDIIDPRYYFEDVSRLVNSQMITDILFLYNSNTLMQDTSIADCLVMPTQE